jgi:hypothetical protein
MESSPGRTNGAQGASQGEPGGAEHERQPGAMQGPAQGGVQPPRGQAQGRSGTEQSRGGVTEQRSVSSPTLSPGQKTRLHEIIAGGNLQRVNHADFALSVGTRMPNTVTLYDVPATIVDILPQYSGFEYVVVGDELVIIDPETLEVVAVLPA